MKANLATAYRTIVIPEANTSSTTTHRVIDGNSFVKARNNGVEQATNYLALYLPLYLNRYMLQYTVEISAQIGVHQLAL